MRAPSSCGRWSSRTRWSSAASVDERAVAFVVTGATGLEPATSGVTGRRSNQLNYAPGLAWPGAAMSMRQHAPRGSQPDSRPRTIAWGWRATGGPTRMAHSLPIEQHGIIGDLHTFALVGTDGTIDWYCPERFDSPSVFAAILDADRGGYYRIAPAHSEYVTKQLYFPDTNVLITRFLTPHGVGEVQDFMPIHRDPAHRRQLLRRVLAVRGEMKFMLVCRPRFDYGRATHTTLIGEHGATFSSEDLRLALVTAIDLEPLDDGVAAEFHLTAGESAIFSLEKAGAGPLP